MNAGSGSGFVNELRARGWAVLPAPRQVELDEGTVRLDADWKLALTDVKEDDIAVRTLLSELRSAYGVELAAGEGGPTIRLAVRAGTVQTKTDDPRDEQAYLLRIAPQRIEITGNARAGLFYGVQTLLQLLAGDGRERLVAPVGTIRDWPRYELRVQHWDTKHHQDRPETLKRYLDWAGRFKLNAVCFELEDKFEYPSNPIIGAPGAFTTEQLQELVDYGLERHIQIIPNIQAPAHMCYVLKHERFAHLRCDGSNYMSCMDEPEVRKLIFQMYDDVCAATKGVEYFHVSTDEVYYAGICEKFRKPYNPVNRSLTWVDFVNAAYEHLTKKGRKVIIWLEFPLLAEHVRLLPADILDGILSPGKDDEVVQEEIKRGIRQFAYCPIQGAEKLFPSYFAHDGSGGRLADTVRNTLNPRGDPIGVFVAAWDDSGLHNETFWLGWAAMAQGGWSPGQVPIQQTVADFMDIYYGRGVRDMVQIYRALQDGARFWEGSWDRRLSKVRGPAYGSSHGKRPVNRTDMTLLPPALPKLPDLALAPTFAGRYEKILKQVPRQLRRNDWLIARLLENLPRARRNRYNLEVFLALAYFQRHHLRMLQGVAAAERELLAAAEAEAGGRRSQAVGLMLQAHRRVGEILDDLRQTYSRLKVVWEKSTYPRNREVEGKKFVHVMDDVKDHFADRRADLTYMIAPEESIGLEQWRKGLAEVVRGYAKAHGLALRTLADAPMDD